MKIETFVCNPFQQNTFVLSHEGKALLIDAGFHNKEEEHKVLRYLNTNKLELEKILITHYHVDHVFGTEAIKKHYPDVDMYASDQYHLLFDNIPNQSAMFGVSCGTQPKPDKLLKEGDSLEFCGSPISIYYVPGHSPCSIVFHFSEEKFLFGGDVLFNQSIGRTDLPLGDHDQLITGIQEKLMPLADDTVVYCGHGPETCIGFERTHNPFIAWVGYASYEPPQALGRPSPSYGTTLVLPYNLMK